MIDHFDPLGKIDKLSYPAQVDYMYEYVKFLNIAGRLFYRKQQRMLLESIGKQVSWNKSNERNSGQKHRQSIFICCVPTGSLVMEQVGHVRNRFIRNS